MFSTYNTTLNHFPTQIWWKVFVLINCECKSSWSLFHILHLLFTFLKIFESVPFSRKGRKLPTGRLTRSAQDLLVSLWHLLVRSSIFPAGLWDSAHSEDIWEDKVLEMLQLLREFTPFLQEDSIHFYLTLSYYVFRRISRFKLNLKRFYVEGSMRT